MSQITTHILDTSSGTPAKDVAVTLYFNNADGWQKLAADRTNQDGRIGAWLDDEVLAGGQYKLHFATAEYYEREKVATFYPFVEIIFTVADDGQHYHVPLLLNPFGYSTYRGS